MFARGTPPEASYLFKHALVQDAAYGSLLRSRRQRLHRRIVAALEERFPEIVLAQPALLAQHCQEAGLAEQAVAYWLKAGQQALARSAMAEAVAQLRKGLDVLAGLPDGPWRQQQELDLQTRARIGADCHERLVGGGSGRDPRPSARAGRATRSARVPDAADRGPMVRFISCEPSTGWHCR